MNPHVYELLSQKRLSIMGVQGGNAPLKILLNSKIIIPLPRQRGNILRHGLGAGGGERAPVALCREPVSAPASVGAERSPPATSARAGRRDQGGGLPIASPPAGETRGWVSQTFPWRIRQGWTSQILPTKRERPAFHVLPPGRKENPFPPRGGDTL